ncbi:MAG: hypothetical protein ACNI27_16545 [Desulfovibrio sp.]
MMGKLNIDPTSNNLCETPILISGSARSGTTIIGKLLHTMKGVEYNYEPPVLFSLFATISDIPTCLFKLYYETYLYEEFFVNSIAGRFINCNTVDDTSIHQVKTAEEISKRLDGSLRKDEVKSTIDNPQIIYKMPDIVPMITKLLDIYPRTRTLIMRRDALGVFHSIKKKGWFSDEVLKKESRIWPFRFIDNSQIKIPFWVPVNQSEFWVSASEVDRIGLYYLNTNSEYDFDPSLIVHYGDLVEKPRKTMNKIMDTFGLTAGGKTEEILATISNNRKKPSKKIFDEMSPDIREKVLYWSSR